MEYMVRDVNIYYEIHGSGRPVVSIHGWSPDHRLMKGCLEPIFQSLDTPWKRIYFDLPGMGKTKGQPWIDGSDRMLEVILEFIEGIIPGQQFVLAGESYGGYLARGLIHQRPEIVDGLLLICPLFTPYVTTPDGVYKGDVPEFRVLERDEALLQELSEEERAQLTAINVVQNRRVWERFRDEIVPGLEAADNVFLENSLGRNVPFSFAVDRLEQPYPKPTLMLMGRQDSMVGYRGIWSVLEDFPRASFVILDKAGHNLQIEQDVLFTALVKEWLSRIA